jgi:thiamine pyrophosphate-dependent acetolactate synthase large subunit-like protein
VYDLTGCQATASGLGTDLAAVAAGCGIERTQRLTTIEEFATSLAKMLLEEGPWCLVVTTGPTRSDRKKPLTELRRRFVQLESFIDAASGARGMSTR